jgi:glycine/D-amino acid oxidase-like deaminating enzyme/nitrite reductase/ring-hydroxylating ferredoxin subunit
MPPLNGTPESCWVASAPRTDYPSLAGNTDCDVVVIGAGIAGLTAALQLCEAGKSVVVLEAREVGRQVTGRSTAKITTQHALIYKQLLASVGREQAQAYAEVNRLAVARIGEWIERFGIDCDYARKSAFAYACSADWKRAIEEEAEAARSLGFEARVHERAPLPFATSAALEFPDQAQFNPTSYLVGLAAAVTARGGRVFEHCRAKEFEHDSRWRVGFDGGSVSADRVVMATHLTVKTPVGYANRTQPRCHVAMAFRAPDGLAVDGMFIGVDEPTHSIRMGRDTEGPLLVLLGPRFNTGQDGDVARRFVELEQWAGEHFGVGQALWRWCNEDYDTPDRMPYVGEPAADQWPGFHVAVGFSAWGISNGTAAGLMLAEQIVQGHHRWGNLFDPTRQAPEDFHQSGDTQSQVDDVAAIPAGGGGVIDRNGEKLAVWRDDSGACHAVSATCTHKGCTVTWNNADRTWDCPCHGSVFEAGGQIIHGPAREPLAPRSL